METLKYSYNVEITFRGKNPSVSITEIFAYNKDDAKQKALLFAYRNGLWCDQPVKKVNVVLS